MTCTMCPLLITTQEAVACSNAGQSRIRRERVTGGILAECAQPHYQQIVCPKTLQDGEAKDTWAQHCWPCLRTVSYRWRWCIAIVWKCKSRQLLCHDRTPLLMAEQGNDRSNASSPRN